MKLTEHEYAVMSRMIMAISANLTLQLLANLGYAVPPEVMKNATDAVDVYEGAFRETFNVGGAQ